MARGWESKSVEAQQAEASEKSIPHQRLTPEQAERVRKIEGLRLSRQRIAQQLSSNLEARHRKMLEDALSDLEKKILDASD